MQREMRSELRCKITLPAAVDAADTNEQTAGVGNVGPPVEDFANYLFKATHRFVNAPERSRFSLANESPRVKSAAPSSTISLSRNPPDPESAGKPPRLFSQPGSENKNVSVVRNANTASTLPIADSFGASGRIAISAAAVSSAMPITLEVACRLKTLYIQLMSGLV